MQNAIQSNRLIAVPFHEDTILATQFPNRSVWVVIKRICESLRLDFSGQLQKLKNYHWATVEFISTLDTNGSVRETCVIPLDHLPMWMVTIHPSKVDKSVRKKLMAYQTEARDALARHFLGRSPETIPVVAEKPATLTGEALDNALILFSNGLLETRREFRAEIVALDTRMEDKFAQLREEIMPVGANVDLLKARALIDEREKPQSISVAEKNAIVRNLFLGNPGIARLSNSQIAQMVQFSAPFIGGVRAELETEGRLEPQPIRETVNHRSVDTTNLGGRRPMTNGTV